MIIIEREALLSVLNKPPLLSSHDDELEYVLVSPPKENKVPLVKLLRPSTSFDDDCCSLSSSTCSDDDLESKRVTFSNDNDVHIVEKLYPKESLVEYFYSYEDTQRFRQEYRLEKKLLAELDVDPSCHEADLSNLVTSSDFGKHHISHVFVLHNDKIETFCDPKQQLPLHTDDFFDNDSFWSGSITWY